MDVSRVWFYLLLVNIVYLVRKDSSEITKCTMQILQYLNASNGYTILQNKILLIPVKTMALGGLTGLTNNHTQIAIYGLCRYFLIFKTNVALYIEIKAVVE